MAGGGATPDSADMYSSRVGFIFIFNLIVGTGALTMPKAFQAAGWLVSLILVGFLAFTSYITVTFMIEAMAAANALRRCKRMEQLKETDATSGSDPKQIQRERVGTGIYDLTVSPGTPPGEWDQGATQNPFTGYADPAVPPINNGLLTDDDGDDDDRLLDETAPLLPKDEGKTGPPHVYDITERVEMGQMASMFFNKGGVVIFNIIIIVYLYGDLAIYAAAIPKSLRDVICTHKPIIVFKNATVTVCNTTLTDDDLCWDGVPDVNRINAYRICLAFVVTSLGSFVFFEVSKTKYLQLFTTVLRWLAFITMVVLACRRLGSGKGEGTPPVGNFAGVPTLFGVCVYSFMCHHSLPSLTAPIRDKSKLLLLMSADYLLILGFYALLSFTGIFAFRSVKDLYTLNFLHDDCESGEAITDIKFIQYFLALFPVFTISTNFPIIGITLRNNIKTLCLHEDRDYPWAVDRLLFPLVTLIPPIIIAMITNKVDVLVGITGSYAGSAIQYIFPACMVLLARRQSAENISPNISNKHASPFKHKLWVYAILAWAVIAIIFVTANHIIIGK